MSARAAAPATPQRSLHLTLSPAGERRQLLAFLSVCTGIGGRNVFGDNHTGAGVPAQRQYRSRYITRCTCGACFFFSCYSPGCATTLTVAQPPWPGDAAPPVYPQAAPSPPPALIPLRAADAASGSRLTLRRWRRTTGGREQRLWVRRSGTLWTVTKQAFLAKRRVNTAIGSQATDAPALGSVSWDGLLRRRALTILLCLLACTLRPGAAALCTLRTPVYYTALTYNGVSRTATSGTWRSGVKQRCAGGGSFARAQRSYDAAAYARLR